MLVAAVHVGGEVDRRVLAGVQEAADHLGEDELDQQGRRDGGYRADRAAAGQRQHRVAVGRAVVQDHVGELGQPPAGRVPGLHPAGVPRRGDRDEPVAPLLHQRGHLHDRTVDAGVGDDDEGIGRVWRGQFVEPVHHLVVAFEERIVEDRQRRPTAQHDIAQRDAVGRHEAARPAGDLLGQCLGMAGAERLHDATGLQRGVQEVGRLRHPRCLAVDDLVYGSTHRTGQRRTADRRRGHHRSSDTRLKVIFTIAGRAEKW